MTNNSQKLVRSELNIEKFMFWVTSNCTKQSHNIQRTLVDDSGNRRVVAVTVGRIADKEVGVLRTFDLKMFYVLLRHWQEAGRPTDGPIPFAIHDLAQRLNLSWSGRTSMMLKASLERLRFIPIKWENSYFDKETQITENVISGFTILNHLTLHERTKGQGTPKTKCCFQFDNRILKNILQNYSKPLRLNEMLALSTELALMLYTRLDLWMSNTNVFEKKLKNLIVELGLNLENYKYPSQRRKLLETPVAELEGKALSTGIIQQAEIVPTADGEDLKLVVKKYVQNAHEPLPTIVAEGSPEHRLVTRGVSPGVARKLVAMHPPEELDRQLAHFDWLFEKKRFKNPGGWLKHAIERKYALPDEMLQRQEATTSSETYALAAESTARQAAEEAQQQLLLRQSQAAVPDLWPAVLTRLGDGGMSAAARAVLAQLVVVQRNGNELVLQAPSRFEVTFVLENHMDKLLHALAAELGTEPTVRFELATAPHDKATEEGMPPQVTSGRRSRVRDSQHRVVAASVRSSVSFD